MSSHFNILEKIISPDNTWIITKGIHNGKFHTLDLSCDTPSAVHCCLVDIQQLGFKIQSHFVAAVVANILFGCTQSI